MCVTREAACEGRKRLTMAHSACVVERRADVAARRTDGKPYPDNDLSGGAFMNSKRVWEVALTVLVAIFLLVAAEGRHPYGFYMVLRTAATVGGIYWAVRVYQAGPRGWMWAFLAVALLLNPVLPVRMHREYWQPIDMVLGVLLFGWAGYWFWRTRQRA
jgi:hypothetical protein